MPTLTRKEVDEIALLARLHLEPEELERLRTELGTILDYFVTLAVVDTTGVPAMIHAVPMEMVLRPDESQPSLPVDVALKAVPKRDGDLIVVPAIIPGSES